MLKKLQFRPWFFDFTKIFFYDKLESDMKKQISFLGIQTKALDVDAGIYECMLSTEAVDRDGDILLANGVELENYQNNPVVLFGHQYSNPEAIVGRALEITKLPGRGVRIVFQFLERGLSKAADLVHDLWANGFLNAMSAGFIIKDAVPKNEAEPYNGLIVKTWELLEASIVTVPANQNALRLSWDYAKQKSYTADEFNQILGLKRGRVLSKANEDKLRAAKNALEEVLAAVNEIEMDEPDRPPEEVITEAISDDSKVADDASTKNNSSHNAHAEFPLSYNFTDEQLETLKSIQSELLKIYKIRE